MILPGILRTGPRIEEGHLFSWKEAERSWCEISWERSGTVALELAIISGLPLPNPLLSLDIVQSREEQSFDPDIVEEHKRGAVRKINRSEERTAQSAHAEWCLVRRCLSLLRPSVSSHLYLLNRYWGCWKSSNVSNKPQEEKAWHI